MRWTHITLRVNDFERSVLFYRDTCALDVVRDRRQEGGCTVWLGPKTAPGAHPLFVLVLEEGAVAGKVDHLGFQCDSREELDRIAARARGSGQLDREPRDSGGTIGYWCTVRDPDGHIVEFTHGQPLVGIA